MVEDFTLETFEPLVGETFEGKLGEDGEKIELELTAATAGNYETPHREPFSLTFHEEGHEPKPQQIWTLSHDKLGEFQLFLVPHGADGHGVDYGAHFN
jgi:hypothetical protein